MKLASRNPLHSALEAAAVVAARGGGRISLLPPLLFIMKIRGAFKNQPLAPPVRKATTGKG